MSFCIQRRSEFFEKIVCAQIQIIMNIKVSVTEAVFTSLVPISQQLVSDAAMKFKVS